MTESAGPMLDLEISRRVLGEEPLRIPAYSTDNAAANLLLWRLAQTGVAFKIQELEGRHYCILWRGSEGSSRRVASASSESRPFAISQAVLDLCPAGPVSDRALRRRGSGA